MGIFNRLHGVLDHIAPVAPNAATDIAPKYNGEYIQTSPATASHMPWQNAGYVADGANPYAAATSFPGGDSRVLKAEKQQDKDASRTRSGKTLGGSNELIIGDDTTIQSQGGPAMGIYRGRKPNPHIQYGQDDIDTAPTTFNRIGTRWGDMQLKNGWWDTNYGKRLTYREASYLEVIQPVLPGQSRLFGTNTADFVMKGNSPSQWQQYVNQTAGAMPSYPGGPGQVYNQGGPIYNPGSGG